MIAVKEWLTGNTAPKGGTKLMLIVTTDGPGTVQFAHVSGQALNNIPTTPVPIQQTGTAGNVQYYAVAENVVVPPTAAEGSSSVISATPIDPQSVSGTAVDLTLTYYEYTADSGTKVFNDGEVVITPSDVNTFPGYFRVYMAAKKQAGGANPNIEGTMVRFFALPTNNIQVWSDDSPPTQLVPLGQYYYTKTNASGLAAVRVVTNPQTFNEVITCSAEMNGILDFRPTTGYFANVNDPNANSDWIPPYVTGLDPNNNIQIPDSGDTFNLTVNVNGNNNVEGYIRYVVMDNTLVIPYGDTENGMVQVFYSTLVQDPAPTSNQFTYVQMTANDGNITASSPWEVGVDGNLVNLPRDSSQPRVAPLPVVVPDPGPDRIIGLGTLDTYDGLRLALQDFPVSLLTNYGGGTLTVEFRYYMNGYIKKGTDRPPRVYNTTNDPALFTTIPTITVNGSTVEFNPKYVELSKGAALYWGRNPNPPYDMKKVGFEFVVKEGSTQWYSLWDKNTDYYRISTGNW